MAGGGAALVGSLVLMPRAGEAGHAGPVAGSGATVVLQGGRRAASGAEWRRFAARDVRVIALEADPVRQWRGPQAALLAARSTRLLGATSWPEFLLVRGLAEESGRRVRYQRFDAVNATVIWQIA
jgi:hypothetical protein